MALVGNGELAVTESVPELDGPVTGSGNNLAVVCREGDGKDIVVVTDEAAGRLAGRELPQTESLVPRSGKSVGTVRGDDLLDAACQTKHARSSLSISNKHTQSETMCE